MGSRIFQINLMQGFLYPTTGFKRLLAAWLVLPVSLAVLVPPILMGLGLGGTLKLSAHQGLGLTLSILAICVLVGSIPFTCLAGYMLRCRKQVMQGNQQLPPWTGLKSLLRDGGGMDMLGIWFATPALVLVSLALTSLAGTIGNFSSHHTLGAFLMALLGSGAGLICLLLALVYWIFVLLVSPMATLRLALGASPLHAVSLKGILQDIGKGFGDYLLCCVLVWGVSVLFQMAQAAFWPLILVTFPSQVYLQLVWANLLGQYAVAYLPERL
ncbi:DUF4013 domain-containing protein [bacterium]|nr:DUF4013 domain-containing protein [bacterium]